MGAPSAHLTRLAVSLSVFVTAAPPIQCQEMASWRSPTQVRCLAVSPDGYQLYTGGQDPFISSWDIESGELRERLLATRDNTQVEQAINEDEVAVKIDGDVVASREHVSALSISPDGALLAAVATASQKNALPRSYLSLWDIVEKKQLAFAELPDFQAVVEARVSHLTQQAAISGDRGGGGVGFSRGWRSVAFAQGGKQIAVTEGWASTVWDVKRSEFLPALSQPALFTSTQDARWLAAVSEQDELTIWDEHGKLVGRRQAPFIVRSALAFSADEKFLALPSTNKVVLSYFGDRRQFRGLMSRRELEPVTSIAFGDSNAQLASGHRQGQVALWSIQEGKVLETFTIEDRADTFVAFCGQHRRTLITASGTTIQLWDADALAR